MADDVKVRLCRSPMAVMVSPYFNVADKHYVSAIDLADALAYIVKLERQIDALELYLDGPPRVSRSGAPITKRG